MTERDQQLYRCLMNVKPLTAHMVKMLVMARRELDVADDYPAVCKARGKIEVLREILGLKKKLQKKE